MLNLKGNGRRRRGGGGRVDELIQAEVQKRDSTFLLRSGVSCYCEGPRRPVALTRGWPPLPRRLRALGAGCHQMTTHVPTTCT